MLDERSVTMERIASRWRDEEIAQAQAHVADSAAVDERDAAADRRLEVADQILAAARNLTAGLRDGPEKNEDQDLRTRLRDGVDALYEGDTDGAVDALLQAAQPDVKALAGEVLQEVGMQAGLARFKEHFPEVARDTTLATIADGFLESALASGKSVSSAFSEAGEKTRAYLRSVATESGIDVEGEAHAGTAADRLEGDPSRGVIAAMAASRVGAIRSA
jgi:hypothetical protein